MTKEARFIYQKRVVWYFSRRVPGDLNASIERFTHYNHHRDHENRSNLTPSDVYFGTPKLSYSNAKGQNETQSINGVYNTAIKPPNIEQLMSQALRYIKQVSVPKILTTDTNMAIMEI